MEMVTHEHHLFGAASVHAAVAIKEYLKETNQGTIRLYGTPAEEGGSGKVYIARDGYFDDVDVVIGILMIQTNRIFQVPMVTNLQDLPLRAYLLTQLELHKMAGQH